MLLQCTATQRVSLYRFSSVDILDTHVEDLENEDRLEGLPRQEQSVRRRMEHAGNMAMIYVPRLLYCGVAESLSHSSN